jgi:hypothetical protein
MAGLPQLEVAHFGLTRMTRTCAFDDSESGSSSGSVGGTLYLGDSSRLVAVDISAVAKGLAAHAVKWATPPGSFMSCLGIACLPKQV